jgi:hypothetical protein
MTQGNFGAPLYDPVYDGIGVPATITTAAADAAVVTVIDDTKPVTNPAGSGEVRSVGPGAYARIPELNSNGIARDDYIDATLYFNGRTWTVRSYELRGNPNGEDAGEVRFLLKAADVG